MSTQPEPLRRAEHARTLLRLAVGLAVIVGLALVGVGVALGVSGCVAAGVFIWLEGAYLHLAFLARPQPEKRIRRVANDAERRIEIGLRPQLPLGLLCAAGGFVVALTWTLLWTESVLVRVLLLVCLLLVLLVVPDSVRALLTSGRGVTVTAQRLSYRGWSYDAEIDWDAVETVDLDTSNPQRPSIRITLKSGVSTDYPRHRVLVSLEGKPGPRNFLIPSIALDQPWNLLGVASSLANEPAAHRAGYLDSVGTPILTDPTYRLP